jgi:hypothetical protein
MNQVVVKKRRKKKNQSNESICKSQIIKYKEKILNGRMLCIDPSSVSTSSKPGWAEFLNGKLVRYGEAQIAHHHDLAVRLNRILKYFQTFSADIVLIEGIPVRPIRTKAQAATTGKVWLSAVAHSSLVQAIGATKASFDETIPIVTFPATLWHRVSRQYDWGVEDGVVSKSDAADAIRIGMSAIVLLTSPQEVDDA